MLDLKALVLNVNQGHNPELMEVCHMYPGGDPEGVLREESQGGEEREYL